MPYCVRPASGIRLLALWALFLVSPSFGQSLWTATGSLAQARFQTTGTRLNDGRVLVVGSLACGTGCYSSATAEVYDPATGTWTETSPLHVPRFNHVAAALADGRVLVAGGYLTPGVLTASCEIYDPSTGLWTVTGSLSTARQFHKGVALANGKVLVVGGLGMDGQGGFNTLASAELYDPAVGQWSAAGSLSTARFEHSAGPLADGRVLVAGGSATAAAGQSQPTFNSIEIYTPASNSWTVAAPMSAQRSGHGATLLNTGQILVTGGFDASGRPSFTTELYDSTANQWKTAARMRAPRGDHTTTLLIDGGVLAVGGYGNWVVSEIYDANSNSWSPAPELIEGRASHSATLLADGRILAAGGVDVDNNYLTSAELLDLGRDPPAHRLR